MTHFAKTGVVPVVVIENEKDALPAAKAMLAGGMDVMEITMRTAAALECIRTVSSECPQMLVGAGTVISLEQCIACVEAGAKFIVSPSFDPEIVKWCLDNDIPTLPGCVTPTEILAAIKLGIRVIKFFPANVYGGIKAMKALSGPFSGIRFLPTGGVNGENLAEYLAEPVIHAVGGSWLCTKADISAGHFDRITELCRKASDVVAQYR